MTSAGRTAALRRPVPRFRNGPSGPFRLHGTVSVAKAGTLVLARAGNPDFALTHALLWRPTEVRCKGLGFGLDAETALGGDDRTVDSLGLRIIARRQDADDKRLEWITRFVAGAGVGI